MTEETVSSPAPEITADDRLWAALCWVPLSPLFPLISILMLLMEEKKSRAFIRYNAVLSLVTCVALIVLSVVTCGMGALGFLLCFWWAYQAYQGQTAYVPVLSEWIKKQEWA